MNRTILVISYNRPIQDKTRDCLSAATRAGAAYLSQYGCPDVALARSLALTGACNALRQLNGKLRTALDENLDFKCTKDREDAYEASARDVVLMVDDDMVWEPNDAQQLIDHARATGVAASAMYATTLGTLAATRLNPKYQNKRGPGNEQRWTTGLGLLAIPAALLLELEEDSHSFKFSDEKTYTEFTWSHADDGQWWSEDYTLTRRLGGVHLLPIGVGHLKTIPIYPDAETIRKIADGERLPGERDPDVLKHIDVSASRATETRRCVSTVVVLPKGGDLSDSRSFLSGGNAKQLLRCELMTKHDGLHSSSPAPGSVYRWDENLKIIENEVIK